MENFREKKRRFVILTSILIIYVLLMFALAIIQVPQGVSSFPGIDKVVHFAEFLVLGFLLMKFLPLLGFAGKRLFVIALAAGVVLMILSEMVQSFVPNRSPSLFDFMADLLGFVIGMRLAK